MQASERFELIYQVIRGEITAEEAVGLMGEQLVLEGMDDEN